ncbi:MAG TPA: hypothetical protein PKY81_10815 [bacterium]|nr:hypothetical protein [bacterium]
METAGTTKKINSVKYSNVIQIVPVKYCASKNAKLNEGYIFAFLFLDENKNISIIDTAVILSKIELKKIYNNMKSMLNNIRPKKFKNYNTLDNITLKNKQEHILKSIRENIIKKIVLSNLDIQFILKNKNKITKIVLSRNILILFYSIVRKIIKDYYNE